MILYLITFLSNYENFNLFALIDQQLGTILDDNQDDFQDNKNNGMS